MGRSSIRLQPYGRGTRAHFVEFPHPTGDFLRVYFSYRTPIAFSFNGKRVIRENIWGPTTGRHLVEIDGGSSEAKKGRVPGEVFEKALQEALGRWGRA